MNFPKQVLRSALLLAFFSAIVFLVGCKNKVTDIPSVDPEFAEYVSAYTSGLVASDGEIQVVLQNDSYMYPGNGKESAEELFSFSPNIKGKTYWKDSRTIVFKPSEPLKSGEIYIARFLLSKVCDVKESKFNEMEFGFRVIPQDYEVEIVGISASEQQKDVYKLEGYVYTADKADIEQVKKMVQVDLDGKGLTTTWRVSDGFRRFIFESSGIRCTNKVQKLNISWNGSPLSIDSKGEKSITIPTKDEFRVLYVSNDKQQQSPTFVVSFNEPIAPNQDLTGLIAFSTPTTVTYSIEGNQLWVYASAMDGNVRFTVNQGITSASGKKLRTPYETTINFGKAKPQLRSVGSGNILPSSQSLVYPFEAIGLKSVMVQVVRIYERNVGQFFQVNNMDGNNELRRVGMPIYKKRIDLQSVGSLNVNRWCRYALDLTKIIKSEPGAIYQVSIYFRKNDVAYLSCPASAEEQSVAQDDEEQNWDNEYGYGDYTDYYYESDYDWQQRDNPCNSAYYSSDKMISQNLLASDLGIIAKRGKENQLHVAVSNIKDVTPISDVEVEVYNYQQVLLGKGTTSSDGFVTIPYKKGHPFLIIAKWKEQRGYLKIDDGNSLSMSNFDIAGNEIQKGIKGYITGERGVWRPGDSLFVTFIVEDRGHAIPKGHPVVFDFQNPKGQLVKRLVQRYDGSNMYAFRTATSADAITGSWMGIVKIGGVTFSKSFRIETVKPNRLKINLSTSLKKIGDNGKFTGHLNVRWLHGAPAPNLKAVYQATLSKAQAVFKGYEAYNFDDEGSKYTSQTVSAFDGRLNDQGDATVECSLKSGNNLPAVLNANFKGEVFEPGGEFSIDQFSIPYYPYSRYVGMRLPDKDSYWYNTNKDYILSIVSLDNNLRPTSSRVAVEVYKMNSSWWWDRDSESDVSYINQSYSKLISRQEIATSNGRGAYRFRINYPDWGSYYIRMVDINSGHTTGRVVTVYWPYEMGVADNMPEGASLLPIAADVSTVDVGKKCTIRFPGSEGARALISIENGSRVIKQEWVDAHKSSNTYTLKTDEQMTPNIYVSVWLIRPHIRKNNDLPIRQYGLLKLKVENRATHLNPVISIPAVIKPEQNVSITVSEKNGRPMTYTVAMVDEGLLDITRFKIPNPWNTFYAEEALGVKSWDVYNRVIGAYGGLIEKYFTIGGSEELRATEQGKSIRFKPVVKFFGPFTVGKNGKSTHTFRMPNYVGSVKTMVVAANSDYGYGTAEKVSAVKLNVMAVPTLPRVLGPNETISMPVNVFAMAGNIRNVKVSVKAEGAVKLVGASTQNVTFSREGDKMLMFNLKAISATGRAKITVTAAGGKDVSTQVVDLFVREPRSEQTRVVDAVLGAGKSWSYRFAPFGVGGTNSATVEVSTLLPINLSSRLGFLVTYPYGCVEQTTSSVFPQLYLGRLMMLDSPTKQRIEQNVKAGIESLMAMQTLDGGFGYWKGASSADAWGSSYAGHFLLEARAVGYSVSEAALSRWMSYQANASRNWTSQGNSYDDMTQAYRLYTLALAQRPEMGAMNLLKEKQSVSPQTLWRLAAAYALAGQRQVARGIIAKLPTKFAAYKNDYYTYGSDTRDLAMMVETLAELNMLNKAAEPVKRLSAKLGGKGWMSTQETAFSLLAISKTRTEIKPGLGVNTTLTINGKSQKVAANASMAQVRFRPASSNAVSIFNNGKQTTFVRLIMQGIPPVAKENEYSNNLSVKVRYSGIHGETVVPSSVPQGTDFLVTVDVTHPGIGQEYRNLTLSQIFPSGWEVQNPRLTGEANDATSSYTYQDFRDDRVYTHFDLRAGETKRITLKVKATYAGHFYLPSFKAEAMYDASISAGTAGMWVKVVAQ